MEMDSKYHVGDSVRIIGVDKCAFGLNGYMRSLVGEVRTIRRVNWDDDRGCYSYHIDNDRHGVWTWDDSCFEPEVPPELPEFNTSGADLVSLFS